MPDYPLHYKLSKCYLNFLNSCFITAFAVKLENNKKAVCIIAYHNNSTVSMYKIIMNLNEEQP